MLGYLLVVALHILVCVILILVVLLQSGKGADLASAFGGSSTQTVFGSRGPASFLSKMTTVAAVVFMLTSLGLSLMGTRQESRSILDTTKGSAATPAPATPTPEPAKGQALTPAQLKQMQEELQRKAAQQSAAPAPAESQQPAGGGASPGKAAPAKK
jgi:preprotein translocase subunit SecG